MKKFKVSMLLFFAVSAHSFCMNSDECMVFDKNHSLTYHVSEKVAPVVKIAVEMMCSDISAVSTRKPQPEKESCATVKIVQLDCDGCRGLSQKGVAVGKLLKCKDAFCIKSYGRQLLVVGSNARGTAYGILEISRMAGVSPWVWWNGVVPSYRDKLSVKYNYCSFQSPSVEYRGIFINDEDWSLRPWSFKNYEKASEGNIGPKTYRQIFKLLLRLRANTIWPAMHTGTVAFYQVRGNKEMADSFSIVVGTSHCEPLMCNNVYEFDEGKLGAFNYFTNKKTIRNYWAHRLQEVAKNENYYTIGMRGIHDGSMQGVKTMQEKTSGLQLVIDDQRKLLAKYVNKDVTKIPQVFVPYKEVLDIMENGLRLPDDVTLMWCDDNYGYMTRLSDGEQQRRTGGAGVYYHLSYWGRPHDYLWLCTTQPGLIYNEMRAAYNHHARKLWIVNVHDPKIANYDLELFMDMAWNIDAVSPSSLEAHLNQWLECQYGNPTAKRLLPALKEYDRLCAIRKPEFMGWSRVEENKDIYDKGFTPVVDTEFSLTEMNDELDRYLDCYRILADSIRMISENIPEKLHDAFFMQITYPILASEAMTRKMLYAQKARQVKNESDINADRSKKAAEDIRQLTEYYNQSIAQGLWNYSMCDRPRNLPVFDSVDTRLEINASDMITPVPIDSCITLNASDYTTATAKADAIQMLGHSMNAVAIQKGGSLKYNFYTKWSGRAVVRLAMIPTQPDDRGDLRFSVAIDNEDPQVFSLKEMFRSQGWKGNVLRGQALRLLPTNIKAGSHTMTIKALDDHIVFDQWMLDFRPQRKFYVFPT